MTVRTDLLPDDLTTEQLITVEKIMGTIVDIPKQSYLRSGERMLRPRQAQDIDGFTDLVSQVLEEEQDRIEVPADRRITLVQDFPPDGITTEVITFGLVRRKPGPFSRGPAFNNVGVSEVKPHVRGVEVDTSNPGMRTVIMGQKFENEIMLTCWARTNKQANIRARWLEDVMKNWTWYIRFNGIEDFFFMGQDEDIHMALDNTNQVLHGRPMRFYVRTERTTTILEPVIRHIVVKYNLGQLTE
jgi:hypothetical protein